MTGEIAQVGVIGLGTMGAGIVEVFARAGLRVVGVDGSQELADRGRGFLESSTGRAVSRGRLAESAQQEILDRVTWTAEYDALADCDLVIEAVPERLDIKTAIFTKLDGVVRPDTVLASNTSSLSLTEIAAATARPERVVGMHFFNPAPVLKLVEVITTVLSDDAVVERVRDLAERLGKKPVVVRDRAGFVANALLITYLARAIRTYETGHVSREDLDDAGRVGVGFPMGPLTLSDLIGLDVVKEVCDVLYAATHDPSAAPPALLQQLVAAGRLGRKTGSGFYDYEKAGSGTVTPDAAQDDVKPAAQVVVVGESAAASDLAGQIGGGGASLVEWVSTAGARDSLAGVDVVILASDTSPDWVAELLATMDSGATLAVASPGGAAATPAASSGVTVVALRVHPATKGGRLAEVLRSTGAPQVATLRATLSAAGFVVVGGRLRAGGVVDALLYPHLNDAVRMLDSGYATAADIDTAMTAGCGYPEGPLAMIDRIGPAQVAAVLTTMRDETGEVGLTPSPLLREATAAGQSLHG
ncbi:3-hydroxyacyl-CoA dehydrogenase [Allobranchiibius huperziae]|uniref:3-hydroxybutyryl-CoA dehydrogenase n=1 Tax=Allobranchiibius huperziae TaxID=1874116 RepID=A0A853DEZ9_9MICO|nr:3-hydroxybutyryl-CoA dehydrogenase [Allobranchiibius huperziae]NYJ75388.1 3-hydroxybutyryl-CoA dehydrogenase [Allobranchiibius huperziae]